mmetsp:Transcript_3538/g.14347  ORF Transcript_3538/g.14347 Transcript_3538/m.14347 type:complete len:284 (+) Transcript_3538:415-1266(+)
MRELVKLVMRLLSQPLPFLSASVPFFVGVSLRVRALQHVEQLLADGLHTGAAIPTHSLLGPIRAPFVVVVAIAVTVVVRVAAILFVVAGALSLCELLSLVLSKGIFHVIARLLELRHGVLRHGLVLRHELGHERGHISEVARDECLTRALARWNHSILALLPGARLAIFVHDELEVHGLSFIAIPILRARRRRGHRQEQLALPHVAVRPLERRARGQRGADVPRTQIGVRPHHADALAEAHMNSHAHMQYESAAFAPPISVRAETCRARRGQRVFARLRGHLA